MRKVLIWIVIVVATFALGVGAATGAGSLLRVLASPADSSSVLQTSSLRSQPSEAQPGSIELVQPAQATQADPTPQPAPPVRSGTGWYDGCGWGGGNWSNSSGQGWNWQGMGPGMMGGRGMGPGMMGGWNRGSVNPSEQRITLDQAVDFARQYATSYGSNLEVSEVMEFTENFYAVVREADSGRGAFELLVDPFTGAVYPEMGPNMMWNSKYGHMGVGTGDNTLNLEQARQLAQQALDANIPGAQVEQDGISFYGHYTFDYKVNDQIAGMLSVNGVTGDVWPHTWHGQFISEKGVTK